MQDQSRDVYTFCGETCIMPKEVLQKAQNELLDWNGLGIGVMEMSHRSPEYIEINNKVNQSVRSLLNVPSNYKILFMQGGATLQYAAAPMNLLQEKDVANYLVTGYASNRAFDEFKKYGTPNLAAPIQEGYTRLPNSDSWNLKPEGAYLYYTDNETVNGLEFKSIPEVGQQDLICDMTSSLSTKQVDISKYGAIFASAQKNLGTAGVTIVIVRDNLFGKQRPYTPNMFNWKTTLDHNSIFNTSPCFAVYAVGLMTDHLLQYGGVPFFEDLASKRSKLIYDVVDSSHGFYNGIVTEKNDRSRLNAVLRIKNGNVELEEKFIQEAHQQGLVELRGHPSVGGLRISMYNGMPMVGVQKLKDFMRDFQQKYTS